MNRNQHLVRIKEWRGEANTAADYRLYKDQHTDTIKSVVPYSMLDSVLALSLPFIPFNFYNNSVNWYRQFCHVIEQRHQSSNLPDLGVWVWL